VPHLDRRQLFLELPAPAAATWPSWTHAAWLTLPANPTGELQVLVHGAGGDHRYWDWPLVPETHSYVEWCAERGIATLNIDRIGCGSSTRPPADEVDLDAQASVLVRLVEQARHGLPGAPAFDRVVLVGHSMGSVVVGAAARQGAPADAVVLTGYLPVDGTVEMGDDLFDAAFDDASSGLPALLGLVEGYLVSKDFGVDELLWWLATAPAANIAAEKQIKGPASRAELAAAAVAGPGLRQIAIPALAVIGEHDALLLDGALGDADTHAPAERIRPQLPTSFTVTVVPGTGHMLNLHATAHQTFNVIRAWLDQAPEVFTSTAQESA
jgi:pimeloyl-ACP methyl ester carboxylesterase